MSFDQALALVLRFEGGYVNDEQDPGGETKFGISKRAYPNLDIRNLTPELAGQIYASDYWGPSGCDRLTPGMAVVVFDSAVHVGVRRAVAWLQTHQRADHYVWHRLRYYRGLAPSNATVGQRRVG